VEAPDASDPPSLEELEREIRRELDRIEVELGAALDGTSFSPEASLSALEDLTARLESTLAELGRTLTHLTAATPTDLNRLAARTLEDVLVDIEKPLILRAQWCRALPHPTVPPDPLKSLVHRILSLVGRFAHAGDVVSVETDVEAEDVVLRIRLTPADHRDADDTRHQLALREGSLGAFVADLGGRFALDSGADGSSRMEVRLPVGAERR
jgi:hypothetical protein